MLVDLEELKNSPEKQLDLEFNEYIAELNNSVDVTGHVRVQLTLCGVKVKGKVSTDIELTCDRCLNPCTKSITAEFDEDYLFGTLLPDGIKEHELQSNEFVNELNGQTCLDITDIVYQSIILEIPTQNLCSDNCLGNVSYQTSQTEDKTDPRLEKLKDYANYGNNN